MWSFLLLKDDMEYTDSLKTTNDFSVVYQNGQSTADRQLVLYWKSNNSLQNRIGISISKKVGNSVERHRLKRLIKECYRLEESNVKKGYDFIFVVRKGAYGKDYKEINESVQKLCKRANVKVDS